MRKAYADNILITDPTFPQCLVPGYANSGRGGKPVPRPHMGGATTGFHAMPLKDDQFFVLYEQTGYPIGVISVTDFPERLFVLQPGESIQLASNGRYLGYLNANGTTVMFHSADGNASISIDTSNNITMTTNGTIHMNATGGVYAGATHLG